MWRTADPNDPEAHGARTARVVVLVATALFVMLLTRGRPWDLFDRAGFSSDFYDEQARAFLHGRLWVDPSVAGMEGFVIDGRTYLYYGPLLALLRLPFAWTHVLDGRLVRLSMTIGFLVLCTGAFHLVVQARKRFDGTPSAWRTAGFVAAVATSPVLALTGWVSVYHETELWAAAFAVWAIVGAARLLDAPDRNSALLTAGAVVGALLTRASVGIGVAVGVGGAVVLMLRGGRVSLRHAGVVIGGCVLGFGVHVAINAAKFGSLLGLPAERQVLTLQNPERAAWFAGNHGSFFGLRFAPTTLVHYLRPDTIRFERLLPFIRFGPLATDRGSYPMETITPSASLTAAATLLFCGAVIGTVIILRRRDLGWVCLALGAAVAAVPTFTIAFIGNRYLVDMLPMLMIPAAAAFASLAMPAGSGRRLARIALIGGSLWGAWVNTSLALWTAELKQPGFTEWRYRLDDLVFGNPAPGLRLVGDGPVGRDGEVALDLHGNACDGVYIAEQGRWVPLERANGEHRLTGTIAPSAAVEATTVAAGAGWQIDLATDATQVTAVLRRGNDVVSGTPVDWSGGPVEVDVVVDPVVPELSVTIDGALSLFRFDPPADRPQASAGFVTRADRGDSLCRQLAARR